MEKEPNPRLLRQLTRIVEELNAIRMDINRGLSKVTEENFSQALTQKKNLKAFERVYHEKLEKTALQLPSVQAATLLEREFDYIITIRNILDVTRTLKTVPEEEDETVKASRTGLLHFYEGLRAELAAYDADKKAHA